MPSCQHQKSYFANYFFASKLPSIDKGRHGFDGQKCGHTGWTPWKFGKYPHLKRGIVLRKLVIRFNAPATLTFALLALGALLLGQTFGSAVTMKYFCVYRASLADPLTYLRFFTHVLGHADYSHYMSNMLLLLLVGPPLEEKYGWKKMVWFMAATALVTGLVQFIFFPNSALLGASGIVFMMIVLSSFTESRGGGIPITLILVVIFYLGGEIIDGIRNTDSVSQLTHVVGGVLGMIFGFLYRGGRRR